MVLHEAKVGPEFAVERVGVIANNVQATAFGRTLGAECRNDDVAAGLDRIGNLAHVSRPVVCARKEVEDRSVVPYVILMSAEGKNPNIAAEPLDFGRFDTKPGFGDIQCD